MSEARKQLTIRTGAVKRLTKELKLYKEERTQEEKRVDKIKADGADQHDVKHAVRLGPDSCNAGLTQLRILNSNLWRSVLQEEVLAEAGMMIPIARQKLKDSAQELSTLQVISAPAR